MEEFYNLRQLARKAATLSLYSGPGLVRVSSTRSSVAVVLFRTRVAGPGAESSTTPAISTPVY